MNICIIIPIYNEAKAIGGLIQDIKKFQLDVIVIDDGSFDGSGQIAQKGGAIIIRNDCKNGKGYSLQKGFDYAVQRNYEGLITMDGDGQHDPADVSSFLEKIHQNPHAVITGNRMEQTKDMPWTRLITNWFLSFLISRICGQKIPDTQCGFRYIPLEILRKFKLTSNDYEIETEVLAKASRLGYPILSIPVKTIYKDEESHIHPVKDTIRFFKCFFRELRAGK